MNTIITAEPDIITRRGRTPSENDLLDRLRGQGSWIWTVEREEQPNSPSNEQRAFRKVHNYPPNRGKPRSATIMVAADDYGAMYVNGVLAAPAKTDLDWTVIVAYEVPLPLVQGDNSTSMVLGFRVINRGGMAGLLAGVLVNYDDAAPPDVFYTGSDDSWLGERLFQEHWEHPVFDSSQALKSWRPAIIFPSSARPASRPGAVGDQVIVLGQLPPIAQGPSTLDSADSAGAQGKCPTGAALSTGGLVGVIIATAVAAFVIGALGSFFLTRRRENRSHKIYEGVSIPETHPGAMVHRNGTYVE